MRVIASCLFLTSFASLAAAQSYNIDFGDARSAPSSTYNAGGLAGAWNAIGVPTPGTFYPLVNLAGQATGASLNNIGGTQLLAADNPATAGDDQALMDDMLIGFNNPIDVCIWLNNIPNGEWEVLIYALTPNDPGLISRTRVDNAVQGPAFIGGAWPGQQQLGLTFSRHTVTIFNNRIGLHSGEISTLVQSGINGIQVRRLIDGDATGNGLVNVEDLLAVIVGWGACTSCDICHADFDGNCAVDADDLLSVITNWG